MGAIATLPATWQRAIYMSPVPMVIVALATREVLDANNAALQLFTEDPGAPLELSPELRIDERYSDLLNLLASGRLDGSDTRIIPNRQVDPTLEIRAWVRRIVQEAGEIPAALVV